MRKDAHVAQAARVALELTGLVVVVASCSKLEEHGRLLHHSEEVDVRVVCMAVLSSSLEKCTLPCLLENCAVRVPLNYQVPFDCWSTYLRLFNSLLALSAQVPQVLQ